MTISEMVITAMVASPATVYLECEGKRYRDAVELANEYGDRFIKGAQILPGGGIVIEVDEEIKFDPMELPEGMEIPEGLAFPPGFIADEPAFEPDGLLDGQAPAEEVLGANE